MIYAAMVTTCSGLRSFHYAEIVLGYLFGFVLNFPFSPIIYNQPIEIETIKEILVH